MAAATLVVVVAAAPATRTSDDKWWPHRAAAAGICVAPVPRPALCGRICWSGPAWPTSHPPAHPGESPPKVKSHGPGPNPVPGSRCKARSFVFLPVQGLLELESTFSIKYLFLVSTCVKGKKKRSRD